MAAQTPHKKGKVVVDAGSSLNIRKAPSVNADVVGSLYKDDIVTIISETSGWYQIVTSTGVSGYVSAEYIQKIRCMAKSCAHL